MLEKLKYIAISIASLALLIALTYSGIIVFIVLGLIFGVLFLLKAKTTLNTKFNKENTTRESFRARSDRKINAINDWLNKQST